MDLPASYYGKLDKRNPVVLTFERDMNLFISLMKRAASSTSRDNDCHAKGMKILMDIWKKYKHRLPSKFYQERMLQMADFLFGIKLYQFALWQGYSLHLLQFNSVRITDITDVKHFMACFFPEGFDTDQETFAMKIRAMQGCALCIFELEKRHCVLSQKGLRELLHVLNFLRIMMQAFQQHDHLCWLLYNGSLHIYTICRYLMTMNCSAQALEFLLWASISLELSIPLMTAKYLPWIVTLYCAVCQCYYDNKAAVKAEKYARRALGKINELAKLEEQSEVPVTRETRRAYKEASIQLAAMLFKRSVFEARRRPKSTFRHKMKSTLKDIPNGPWPRTTTERMLSALFDSSAAQFLGILEALWDSTRRLLDTRMPDEPELQEVILELLSAGISILSGAATTSESLGCLSALTPTSTLLDLAVTGGNRVPIMSAMRFIKMLFQYKQTEAFTELSREMLQVLSGVEGQSYRRAELEVALLDSFNTLLSSQRSHPKEDNTSEGKRISSFSMNDEFIGLVDTLHKSACASAPEVQLDGDLVLDVLLFLWGQVKLVIQREPRPNIEPLNNLEKLDHYDKWLWCLSMLCEVALACNLATVDCIIMAEMIHTWAMLLESAAEYSKQCPGLGSFEADCESVKPNSFSTLESSSTELLQKVCVVVERGLDALAEGVAALLPQDSSAITDYAFMQKFRPLIPSTPMSSLTSLQEENKDGEISGKDKEEVEAEAKSDIESSQHAQSKRVFLLAADLYLELDIIHHRASLKLLQLNAVTESELLNRIKKNKVSKALFLIQKALMAHNSMEPNNSKKTKSLLEEASTLIEKAGVEERKLYLSTCKTPAEDKGKNENKENPPPAPILLSRTYLSFTFAPAPYNSENQVYWYQLCGRPAEGINWKVRLGDCSLPGTGNMVPSVSGESVMRVEGLQPNQKYVFAVAAYNSQGKLLGNGIGDSTFPLLASLPVPLLSTLAHLAQVAFQTNHYAIAKRACRELWIHYTDPDSGANSTQDRLAMTGLRVQTLQQSSPLLCQLFLTSIFIETEINIQQGLLNSENGPFIWEQETRLAECERMLVAMDLAMWLNDGCVAVQAAVSCYGLLAPIIFHQITCDQVIQVLKKCLIVLEENSGLLKQKWSGNASESFMHMIACITYYLSKALRVLREHYMASAVMDCGRRLLQEIYDAQLQISRLANKAMGKKKDHAEIKAEIKISFQLKALYQKNKKEIPSEAALPADNDIARPLTGCEDPSILYDVISNGPLKEAYLDVMKIRRKVYFIEFATLLLQRTMEEGQLDLVLKWGQSMFEFLNRRDKVMGLSSKSLEGNSPSKRRISAQTLKANEPLQQNKNTPSHDDARKKLKQNMPQSMLQRVRTNRDLQGVENLLAMMTSVVQRHKKQFQLRNICCDERVWKSHLNYIVAQAHLALLYQGLDTLHGGALQPSYGQLDPLCFSLAYSGLLVRRNWQRQQSSKHEFVSERGSSLKDHVAAHKERNKKEASRGDDVTEESCEEGEDCSQTVEQPIETHGHTTALVLDSINKAALHLRRAMVLAHRGSHWTTLQCVCQTLWDQSCRITVLVDRAAQLDLPSPLQDQLNTTFTPLLVLAADLIMDMLNRLGLWSAYDRDLTEDELESSLHFSAPLDNGTQVDLRWVRTLLLHTLERLHDSGKWESLAHFALVFNNYTRERYASIVTPLVVLAQRKLLERIHSSGGPAVPQPHHVKTQKATGKEVTYRSYADSQLLIGWTPHPARTPIHKKLTNSTPRDTDDFKGAEIQHSMSLVCVPLDVEDTLSCYRQALERRPHCLQVFQHSRSLLLQLLAYTKPCFTAQVQQCQSRTLSHSTSLVDFNPLAMPSPNIQPCDLSDEDYSSPNALYSLPISPEHMPTVSAAYSASIKYLRANHHDSLRVLALHEKGNLEFYNGNPGAAHSYWSKAVDCALQSSGAVENWDGVSLEGGSLQETLKQAGIWGCLQAAVLTAKIAQYILTADISQRTNCCLMSAHFFKCVLCCSLAQPQGDIQYASHSIGDELLPGVDLFSEPHRVPLSTTVVSLNFVCHWLYTEGYYITLLPILALYLHFVGSVCRDFQRTIEAKILKMRALTELCLFTEAVKDAVQLTQGTGIPPPYGHCTTKDNLQPVKMFYSNKSLLDNTEALEELINCEFAPEVSTLYGSTLGLRFKLARTQLVLALSNTVRAPPDPDVVEGEAFSVTSKHHEEDRLDTEGSSLNTEEPKMFTFGTKKENLTPETIKFILLEVVSSWLHPFSQQLSSLTCSKMENLELTIESKLLKASLYLQQGNAAYSSKMAISSFMLLQTSPVIMKGIINGSPASDILHTPSERVTQHCSVSHTQHEDSPRAVEAGERVGPPMWLRCRLALVRSLTSHIPGTAELMPGKNINVETTRILQEGLDECARWGDIDIQALLMVEGAELKAKRGKTGDSVAMLQDAVTLLSERTCMPPGSSLTLARATLLLSDLRGVQSTTILKLTQKFLTNQLSVFGQRVVSDDGKMCYPPPGPSNIYLPYLNILDQTTLQIGHMLDLNDMQIPEPAQSSQSTSRQRSHHSSRIGRDSVASVTSPSLNSLNTTNPTSPPCLER
ncbi:LOW QUALITY PROTEIN: cilia- and flagella-associated protein 54-like [Eleginops maclovinus]|uniref:LOW QUALITY PROTEIN: cilia- and flagella-associated protein 54-like n=1 Tax=Eleginops maclovinus TaxID=56733 RepID=UPI0030801530